MLNLALPWWWKPAAAVLALVLAFGGGWTVATWRAEAARAGELADLRRQERRAWEREVAGANAAQAAAEGFSADALADVATYRAEAERLRVALASGPLIEYREVPVREGETVVRVPTRGARFRLCFNAAISGDAAAREACEAAGVYGSVPAEGVPAPDVVRPGNP